MFGKIIRTALLLALTATAYAVADAPAALAQDDDEPRQDVTIGNPDRMRSGTNERGDNEMVIEPKPKRKQDVPELGPIYVIPQVNNQGYGPVPGQRPPNSGAPVVPVPVPQQQPRPVPQGPGRVPAHP